MHKIKKLISGFFSRRSGFGVLLALIAFYQSLTPSLLPRTWAIQGLVSGALVVVVYLVAAGFSRLAHKLGVTNEKLLKKFPNYRVQIGWFALALMPIILLISVRDRDAEWDALGFDLADRFLYSGVLLMALLIITIGSLITLAIRKLFGLINWGTKKVLPRALGGFVSVVLATVVVLLIVNEAFYNRFLDSMNDTWAFNDTNLPADDSGPVELPTKSGTESSLVTWSEIGREGRFMMSRAPRAQDITERTGRPALDPIRAYVGRPSAQTYEERAELAVAELERMDGFSRKVLLVLTPTGTGWMNEQLVQPLEYFFDGNVATVGMQYSHLPSPFAFQMERRSAVDSAEALLTAVQQKLSTMENPPLLLVAGESLGAYGGQGPIANLDALVANTDGAIWTGSPPMAHLRREAEARRDAGSLQMRPEISALPQIVFGSRPEDFINTQGRYAFLQHANDPIVWWDNSVIFSKPDWMSEPLDSSLNPNLRWRPITTYLQFSADMAAGNAFEEGFGHRYGALPTRVWWEMLDPAGWSEEQMMDLYNDLDKRAGELR